MFSVFCGMFVLCMLYCAKFVMCLYVVCIGVCSWMYCVLFDGFVVSVLCVVFFAIFVTNLSHLT